MELILHNRRKTNHSINAQKLLIVPKLGEPREMHMKDGDHWNIGPEGKSYM